MDNDADWDDDDDDIDDDDDDDGEDECNWHEGTYICGDYGIKMKIQNPGIIFFTSYQNKHKLL